MSKVGIRALKQNASAVVAKAAAGEMVTITDRGRPAAQMGPVSSTRLQDLIAAHRARPAHRSFNDSYRDHGARPVPGRVEEVSEAIAQQAGVRSSVRACWRPSMPTGRAQSWAARARTIAQHSSNVGCGAFGHTSWLTTTLS
ncbi:MAG: type II toxin-antitoxin system prevent-host-death family antitoxin [Acidimicrobiia bacterium]|nr:type II toxin-antitoxin system prevent-host-death family antitoxin [Acidimicrobiia bacterium]